jgi:hypothetical protein
VGELVVSPPEAPLEAVALDDAPAESLDESSELQAPTPASRTRERTAARDRERFMCGILAVVPRIDQIRAMSTVLP